MRRGPPHSERLTRAKSAPSGVREDVRQTCDGLRRSSVALLGPSWCPGSVDIRGLCRGLRARLDGLVVQALEEGRLQLGDERLEGSPGLADDEPQGAQDGGLDLGWEAVAEDPDQGARDLQHEGLEGLGRRRADEVADTLCGELPAGARGGWDAAPVVTARGTFALRTSSRSGHLVAAASAAHLSSVDDPWRSPWMYMGTRGAMPLGRHSPAMVPSPLALAAPAEASTASLTQRTSEG